MPFCSKQKSLAGLLLLACLWGVLPHHAFARHQHNTPHSKNHTHRSIPSSIMSQFMLNGDDAAKAETITENLWGSWLLQSAMQHDEELQHLMSSLNRVDNVSTGLFTASSSFGIAQGITAYIPRATLASNDLGLISATVPYALIGGRAFLMERLKKRIQHRQDEIIEDITQVMAELSAGKPFSEMRPKLAEIIGPSSAEQFLKLWWLLESTSLPMEASPSQK